MCNVFEAIHFRKNLFNWLAHSNRAIMLFAHESAQIVQGDWKAALKIPENILKFVLEKKSFNFVATRGHVNAGFKLKLTKKLSDP